LSRKAPAAIVPAAGASTRMGRPKLLLPWGATTVLGATVEALRAGGVATVVVVAAPGGPLAEWAPPQGMRLVVNADPRRGMLSSILAGLAALTGTDAATHRGSPAAAAATLPDPLLVCPADLPGLLPSTVAALLAAYATTGGIVVPRHGGRRGHPLLVAPHWQARMPELRDHEGGLRRILELAAGAVHEMVVDDPGTVHDVDTPEDYSRLRPW
jgi:CTP:molybdopterin cytidylyltransferase MocA